MPLENVRFVAERVRAGAPVVVVVLLEPPPHPATVVKIATTRTTSGAAVNTRSRDVACLEDPVATLDARMLNRDVFIAPPRPRDWTEASRVRTHVHGKIANVPCWKTQSCHPESLQPDAVRSAFAGLPGGY